MAGKPRAGFEAAMGRVLDHLARDLGVDAFSFVEDAAARAVRLEGRRVRVPASVRRHWDRFGVLPTNVIRDAAVLAKAAAGADEADAVAYAEAFLRHVWESED